MGNTNLHATSIVKRTLLALALTTPVALLAQTRLPAQSTFTAAADLQIPSGWHLPSAGTEDRELRSISRAVEWINSPPLSAESVRGKVVLVDFWTYTCINWIRTAPYVRAWAEKYKDQGLVVIGAHTPEFAFERNVVNVRRAVEGMRLTYPVAIDSDFTIWRAFGNNAWPALYFVDAQGRVRHRHLGEGDYQRSEMMIQKLLAEAGAADVSRTVVSVEGLGAEAAADWDSLRSPEMYVGYDRAQNFASRGGAVVDKARVYASPSQLRLNHWALTGDWTVKREFATLNTASGRIALRFHARDVHLVMGPAASAAPVRFRVLIDGQPPGVARGADVDAQGNGLLSEQRMHQLIRQVAPVTERTFEIEFLDPGAEAFAFTFG